MRTRVLNVALGVAALLWAGSTMAAETVTTSTGKATHHHPVRSGNRGMYGGRTWAGKDHLFETVFVPDGIRVYVYSPAKAPESLDGVAGTISLKFTDGTTKDLTLASQAPASGDKAVYYCTMHPEVIKAEAGNCPKCNMPLVAQNRLFGAVDLSGAKPGAVTAEIHLTGLSGEEKEVTFSEINGHARVANSGATGAAKTGTKS